MRRVLLLSAAGSVVAENPVTKVVSLLNDMQSQMQKDAKADQAAFNKMECWCRTNREEKSAAVEKAQKVIKEQEGIITARTGTISQLQTEIKNLKADVATAEDDIKKATALRKKEAQEAAVAQKDMSDTIAALTTALGILEKVQTGFVQKPTAFTQIKQTLKKSPLGLNGDLDSLMAKLDNAHRNLSIPSQKNGFLQQEPEAEARDYSKGPESPNAKKGGVAGIKSYGSNSGGIYGLLDQMKADFENQLKDSQESEALKTETFNKLVGEKKKSIAFSKSEITAKQKDLGTAQIEKSNAKKVKEETTMELTADQKFQVEMEADCKESVEGYAARSTERADEMKAVGEAIGFLTSDEARDIFNKGYGSFLQIHQHISKVDNKKEKAKLILLNHFSKSHSKNAALALAAVSTMVTDKTSLDAFSKVKEALTKLHEELALEQKEEFKTRDTCVKNLQNNENTVSDATTLLEDTEAAAADYGAKIESLIEKIKSDKDEIAAINQSVADATATRKDQNAAYKEAVNDQELVIKVLKVALSKLEGFYGALGGGSTGAGGPGALIQEPGEASSAKPKQATYKRQQGGNGALGLITVIIQDAEHAIKIMGEDEQNAQGHYEKLMADSKEELTALNKSVVTNGEQKGNFGTKKEEAESLVAATKDELLSLGEESASLHSECDFLLKNFDVRQQARTDEMESIEQAKQVLSGADFE